MKSKTCCVITDKVYILNPEFDNSFKKAIEKQIESGCDLFLVSKSSYVYDDINGIFDELIQKYHSFDVMYLLLNTCFVDRNAKTDCSNCFFNKNLSKKLPLEKDFFNYQKLVTYKSMIDISDTILCRISIESELFEYIKNSGKEIVEF